MLDTKLKSMRRVKNSILVLCALVPALILVSLYPKMERAMLKLQEEREQAAQEEASNKEANFYLADNFVNYAVEASYYIYGQMRQQQTSSAVDFSVLDEYGWINDYYYVNNETDYYALLDTGGLTSAGQNESVEALDGNGEASETEETTETEETPETGSALMDPTSENGIRTEDTTTQESDVSNSFETSEQSGSLRSMEQTNAEKNLGVLIDDTSGEIPQEFLKKGMLGYLTLEYDVYGQLSDIRYAFREDIEYNNDFYRNARDSVEQYKVNAEYYYYDHGVDSNVDEGNNSGTYDVQNPAWQNYMNVCPKNFEIVYALYESSDFLVDYSQEIYQGYHPESVYIDIGSYWVPILLAVVVALAALLLPFVKKLQTGWEKLFCIPFEVNIVLIIGGIAGAGGMFIVMCHTTMTEMTVIATERSMNFLGMPLSATTLYGILLVLNFLGWAVLYFAEYVVVASLRQFFCGPKYYLQNRLLITKIFRWLKMQLIKLYDYVADIDINDKLISSILKIVAVNFAILTILCCCWFFGIFGLLIYSVFLFFALRKYGEKLQQQYRSILNAMNQMVEGNLKITLDEDLGILQPIGDKLEKVQQGFAKAVMEEAKSQNMKTELITNVSHDLKTPLTAIITYVDLLKKEGITDEERDSYIATIDQKSQRLKVLIEDLFEVSKANSGNIQMHFMDVDVVNLMKQVRLEMEEKIADSDLNFRWNLPEKHVMLSLDGQRTYRIFENLLNNILKYSMPYTRVYIDVLDEAEEVHILFRNISAVELEGDGQNLTDRFVRGDASRNTEGSGLGLAIVKSFVELQNGKLNIDVDGDLFKVTIIWKKTI